MIKAFDPFYCLVVLYLVTVGYFLYCGYRLSKEVDKYRSCEQVALALAELCDYLYAPDAREYLLIREYELAYDELREADVDGKYAEELDRVADLMGLE